MAPIVIALSIPLDQLSEPLQLQLRSKHNRR